MKCQPCSQSEEASEILLPVCLQPVVETAIVPFLRPIDFVEWATAIKVSGIRLANHVLQIVIRHLAHSVISIVQNAESLEIQASSQHASVRKIVAGIPEPVLVEALHIA